MWEIQYWFSFYIDRVKYLYYHDNIIQLGIIIKTRKDTNCNNHIRDCNGKGRVYVD